MSFQTRVVGWLSAGLTMGLVLAQPVNAQDKSVGITVRGGGFNALTDLNDAATADFKKTGYNVGGGLNVDLHKYIALRGDFTFARNELRQNEIDTGFDLNRFYYDAGVQVQYSTETWKPYVFVGAGAVTLHPVGTTDNDKTKFAGNAGLGISYNIPGTNFGIGIEGKGWLYEFNELPGQLSSFDKTQLETTWSAGLSYRIPVSRRTVSANR